MTHSRYREYVPAMPPGDARRLRGLPASWGAPIVESAVDALERRAVAVAGALAKRGRRREADELRRAIALLERADELHRHASDVETLTGLYRALALFAHERDPVAEESFAWVQTGAVDDDGVEALHGPAFRETAILRSRAFRLVASTLAKHGTDLERSGA